jgi:hypothetical protein
VVFLSSVVIGKFPHRENTDPPHHGSPNKSAAGFGLLRFFIRSFRGLSVLWERPLVSPRCVRAGNKSQQFKASGGSPLPAHFLLFHELVQLGRIIASEECFESRIIRGLHFLSERGTHLRDLVRDGWQTAIVTCACSNLIPCFANASRFGVMPGILQPKAPIESLFISSAVMRTMLRGFGADSAVAGRMKDEQRARPRNLMDFIWERKWLANAPHQYGCPQGDHFPDG